MSSDLSLNQRFSRWGPNNVKIAVFGRKTLFAKNFWTRLASGITRAPSSTSCQGASNHIHGDFKRLGQYLISGQGHVRLHADPSRSCCISAEASWRNKYSETTAMSLALFYRELLAKNLLVTSGDPRWPLCRSPTEFCIWIINNILILPNSR